MIENSKLYNNTNDEKYKVLFNQYHIQQYAYKILLNSLYGALGYYKFRYYDVKFATSVTVMGKYIIQYTAKKINEYINNILNTNNKEFCIYSDTDSIYITLNDYVVTKFYGLQYDEIINKVKLFVDNDVQTYIDDVICKELHAIFNAKKPTISFKRETIATSAIFAAKKKYALIAVNVEGVEYEIPKIKITGLEIVKSSTPIGIKNSLLSVLTHLLNDNIPELIKEVIQFYKSYKKLKLGDIASVAKCSDIEKFIVDSTGYIKGTPIHIRSAILYNKIINNLKLYKKYGTIHSQNKVKYIYIYSDNKIIPNENIIGFINDLPNEFNINDYIDYELQFYKTYLYPIFTLYNAIKKDNVLINTLKNNNVPILSNVDNRTLYSVETNIFNF